MTKTVAVPPSLLERLAWLELSDTHQRFRIESGESLSHHAECYGGLEYRRFLLLRLMYPEMDISAPPIIDRYWRAHAANPHAFDADRISLVAGTMMSADRLIPPAESTRDQAATATRELYEETFPGGNGHLWGWPRPSTVHRRSAVDVASIHLRLPDLIDAPTYVRLQNEALEHRQAAVPLDRWNERKHFATPGPVLHDLHWRSALSRSIAAKSGVTVVPTAVGYLYYHSGAFIGIHTDGYGCELTLLTLLSGPVEPLYLHLNMAGASDEVIRDLAQASGGQPDGGTPFDIDHVPFLLSGMSIPHQRGPADRSQDVIVLSQCYSVIVP